MNHGTVGIVFSTYNSASYVGKCLRSCLHQRYQNVVIIISDDGSSDHTVKTLKAEANNDPRVTIFELVHGERGIARATAINEAKRLNVEFLYIIDSDMILNENLVSDCLIYLNEHQEIGGLIIPEIAYSDYQNFYSKVKVFERNIINNAGEAVGANSIEAARFWRMDAYNSTGGININQIAFEETQPTIRYLEKGGNLKRAVFTGVQHDEKQVTLKNIVAKKKYYFSVMHKTLNTEAHGDKKALTRWYFFRPVLYRKSNLKEYIKHPLLTIGMVHMYVVLTLVAIGQVLKSKLKNQ